MELFVQNASRYLSENEYNISRKFSWTSYYSAGTAYRHL